MKEVDMEDILKADSHGYRINTNVTDMLILAVPDDNIMTKTGDTLTILGYGCVFFFTNKKGNEVKYEFLISTLFNSKPAAIKTSTHYSGYTDLYFDKDAYFAYLDNPVEVKNNEIPVIKDSTNVELMFNKLNAGKFSEHISYEQQIFVILNNLDLNQHLDKVPLIFYEIRIAKGFIDSAGKEYRYKLSGKAQPISLLQTAMTGDTFSAVTHQDAKTSLMIALADKSTEKSRLETYAFM